MSKQRITNLLLLVILFSGLSQSVLGGNSLKTSSYFSKLILQLKDYTYKETSTIKVILPTVSNKTAFKNCNETIIFIARNGGQIEELNITTGASSIATTSPYTTGNLNSLAANPDASIVYYARGTKIYYWEPATNNHGQLVDLSGTIGSNESFSSGAGAYYNGHVYMGAEDNTTSHSPTVYRVPVSANGMSTAGSAVKLDIPISSWSSWGDMIVTQEKNNTVIYGGLGAGAVNGYKSIYFKYYVELDIYTMVARDLPNELQMAVDVHGDMWVAAANGTELQKVNRKTGARYGNIVTMSGIIWDMTGPFNCPQTVEICGNGIDDDNDGLIDNEDGECTTLPRGSDDCHKTIPSAGAGTNGKHTVTSTLTITENGIIDDINVVSLDITHNYIDDINVTLTSPAGTSVLLMNKPCGNHSNIFVTLDDESSLTSFTCPPNDGRNYQPDNPLSAFDGEDVNGMWTLTIEDTYPTADGGTLNCWALEFDTEYIPAIEICDNNVDDDGDGDIDCVDADCNCGNTEVCDNGIDDDNDGLIDCDDPDCNPLPTGAIAATYKTIADGAWSSSATWQSGNVPNLGDINNKTISIEHTVTIANNNIKLIGNAQLYVTNGSLTFNNGDFLIENGAAYFQNADLTTANGNNVKVETSQGKLIANKGVFNVGQNLQNSDGLIKLENICLTVYEVFDNANGIDSLINVCATIGVSTSGNFANYSGSSMYIKHSEFKLPNGNFDNQSSATLTGSDVKIWLQNGNLQNSGSWSLPVTQYCVSSSVTVAGAYLPASEDCANINDNFTPCDCSCSNTPEICNARITNNLVALYNFKEATGAVVYDVSGVGTPLDLTIQDAVNTSWIGDCGLAINSETTIQSAGAATKVIDAVKVSNAITVEAWVKPANTSQNGPARIVTLSADGYNRNFTLGQQNAQYAVRVRSSDGSTDNNGNPTKYDGTVSTANVQHVVYTWDANNGGTEKLYVDGVEAYSGTRAGTTSNWDDAYPLAIGNEVGTSRDWLGEIYLVAIYDKALSSVEITSNFNEGECCSVIPEICGNGVDDDMDGLTDCEEITCGITIDLGSDLVHCNDATDLAITVTGNTTNLTYTWDNGLGNAPTHTVNPTVTTIYRVTVTNDNSCSAIDSITVVVNGCAELCDNGIDDDNDGKTDCNDEDCPCYIGDSWSYGCNDDICIELVGIGNKNASSATLNVTDVSTVQSVVVEATFGGGSTPPDSVTFTSSIGESYKVGKVYFDGHSGDNGDRYFRTNMLPASEYTLTYEDSHKDNGESFLLYVFRTAPRKASFGEFVHKSFYHATETVNFTIPTSPVARDIDVTVPLSELTNDGRIVIIRATAGGVTVIDTVDNYNTGNSLYINPLVLQNVPGDATDLVVEVESPNVNGQSLYMSGAVSVNVDCFNGLLVEKTVDKECATVGETVNYTYEISNFGTNNITNLSATDDKLGNLILGTTTLNAGANLTINESYTIQQSDLPGPLKNIVTVNGIDAVTGSAVVTIDSVAINLFDINFTHTADKTNAHVGDEVNYTYTVVNNGSSPVIIDLVNDSLINATGNRVTTDLLALYTFKEGAGATIYDVSGVGTPHNLTVEDPANISWTPDGISVDAETRATYTPTSDLRFLNDCQASNEITIEGWVKPANNTQTGSARMIGYTWDGSNWNFQLAQKADDYVARLRTTGNNSNELIGTANSIAVTPDWAHVVYTYDGTDAKLYVDGVAISTTGEDTPTGDFSNWNSSYVITLFNEYGASRDWLGEMALAAFYSRALTPAEITTNFDAGYNDGTGFLGAGETMTISKTYTVQAEDGPEFTNIVTINAAGTNACTVEFIDTLVIDITPPEICGDNIDNDGDGDIDCDDSDCGPTINLGADITACEGVYSMFDATINDGNNYTYAWDNDLGGGAQQLVNPTVTTIYTVTVTDESGCWNTGSITVTVNACGEICDNGIDDDGDGKKDCNDEDCPCFVTDEWAYNCDLNRCIEVYGIGHKNETSATITLADTVGIVSIIVESTFNGGTGSADSVTFSSNIGEICTIQKTYFPGHSGSGGDRYFRTNLRPASTFTLNYNADAAKAESFLIYVIRECENTGAYGKFVHRSFYHDTETIQFDIPPTTGPKDIEITVPLSEITNDGRVVNIYAQSGGVYDTIVINNYNQGNSLNLTPFTLYNVPDTATSIIIEVESPVVNGQSLYLSGAASARIECVAGLTINKTVNANCATPGETVTYTYEVINYGFNQIDNLTVVDDQLGTISMGTTSIAAGDTLTTTANYTILTSDLPGPITSEATVNGTDAISGLSLTDNATTTIGLMEIDLKIAVDSTQAKPGDTVTYTYTMYNNGSEAIGLEITDNLGGNFEGNRTSNGLLALYTFEEGSGAIIHDISGVGTPIDLTIQDPANVTWGTNSITVNTATRATNQLPAGNKIATSCAATGEISIEGWVKPANNTQTGSARMIGYTWDGSNWNFQLAQKADEYAARLRTTGNNSNELIGTANSITATPDWAHIVYTYDGTTAKLYVDGIEISTTGTTAPSGDFSNWDATYAVTLFNEFGATRTWLGEMGVAAFYSRALTPAEITQNFNAGYESGIGLVGPNDSLVVTKKYVVQAGDMPTLTNTATLAANVNCTVTLSKDISIEVCATTPCDTEICDNGIDDDGDGAIDCADSDCGGTPNTISVSISSGDDDAEENISSGTIGFTSSDLELIADGGTNQIVGMRFNGINLPNGATITNAYIEFETDELNSGTTNLTFSGDDTDNALAFSSTNKLSTRNKTTTVSWNNVPAWNTENEKHQTPDLSIIIQEIVNRAGWTPNNSMAILVEGSGERTAESYNGEVAAAPRLVIEYCDNIPPPEICDNGIDDDNDGLIDCADPDCNNGLTVTAALINNSICSGEQTTLSASATGGDGNYTFSWDNSLANGNSHTINPTTSTTYNVTVTDGNGCTATHQVTITINNCGEICDNGIDDDNDGLIDIDCPCTGNEITAISQTNVTVSNPDNAVGLPDGTYADIRSGDVLTLDLGEDIPAGETIQIYIARGNDNGRVTIEGSTSQSSGYTGGISWGNPANNNTTVDATQAMQVYEIVNYTVPSGGLRYIRFTRNNGQIRVDGVKYCGVTTPEICDNGIDDDGDNLVDCADPDCNNGLTVTAALTKTAMCAGDNATLSASATGGDGNFTFTWDNSLADGNSHTINPSTTTTYNVTVTDGNGCTATDQITITITTCTEICDNNVDDDFDGLIDCADPDCNNGLTLTAALTKTAICEGENVTLSANATGGDGNYTFTWDNSIPDGNSHTVAPNASLTYNVTVTDGNGCTTTDQITISVMTCTEICDNGIDDDFDGMIDCDDSDCSPDGANVFDGCITVNSTGDEGDTNPGDGKCMTVNCDCTLRAAIEEANALAGKDTICYDIPGSDVNNDGTKWTITPMSLYENLTEAVFIDGYTQTGKCNGNN